MARFLFVLFYALLASLKVRAFRLMDSFMMPLRQIFAKSASVESSPVAFSAVWQVLGPFQIGTRGMHPRPLCISQARHC